MPPFLAIAISVTCSICAQLLLKHGMIGIARNTGGRWIVQVATSPFVVGGLLIYGLGVIFWVIALSQLELSFAYPFGSLSYIGIILASYFIFKERINRARLLGIGIIVMGLLIISQS